MYDFYFPGICPFGGLLLYNTYTFVGIYCDDTFVAPVGLKLHLDTRITMFHYSLEGIGQVLFTYKFFTNSHIKGMVNPCSVFKQEQKQYNYLGIYGIPGSNFFYMTMLFEDDSRDTVVRIRDWLHTTRIDIMIQWLPAYNQPQNCTVQYSPILYAKTTQPIIHVQSLTGPCPLHPQPSESAVFIKLPNRNPFNSIKCTEHEQRGPVLSTFDILSTSGLNWATTFKSILLKHTEITWNCRTREVSLGAVLIEHNYENSTYQMISDCGKQRFQ